MSYAEPLPSDEVDAAQAALEAIAQELALGSLKIDNEADTRLKVINRVLTDVLGWPWAQIKPEVHTSNGYADYVLKSREDRALCIVEAKKEGAILVDTVSAARFVCGFNSKFISPAKGGIEQAASYASKTGATYAVLTNGRSWLFYHPVRTDGLAPEQGKVIVFPTLDAVRDNFPEFYELAAYPSVRAKLHVIRLARAEGAAIPSAEPRNYFQRPDQIKMAPREAMLNDLGRVFSEFFSTIADKADTQLLVDCFVESRESRETDIALEKITTNLVEYVESISSETADLLNREIETAIGASQGEVVLIVGNKGSGKTTFMERFFRVVISRELRSKCLVAKVNVGTYSGEAERISEWLTDQLVPMIERELFKGRTPSYNELQGMFFGQYKAWMIGEYKHLYESDKIAFKNKFGDFVSKEKKSNPIKYLIAMLRHASLARKIMPCIVFDNTDHHAQAFQEAVFQYAQMINSKALTFQIIPITDRTIWKLSKAGVFQSFVNKTFYLPVPSTREVLSRRILYVRAKTAVKGSAKTYFSSKGIRLEVKNIEAFAGLLEEIFIHTEFMTRLIGWLGNHDLRRSLLIANQIITSPSLGIDKLVAAAISGRASNVRRHEIMRALLFGRYNRFNSPANEFVFNLFDLAPFITTSPLLMFRILIFLRSAFIAAGDDVEQKYVSVSDLAAFFGPMGVDERHVAWALNKMIERRLVEPYDPSQDTFNDTTKVAVTDPGRIHLEFVESDTVYLEQTALVTGMRNFEGYQKIKTYLDDRAMDNRTKWYRVKRTFAEYLLKEDFVKISVPTSPLYASQKELNEQVARRWASFGS